MDSTPILINYVNSCTGPFRPCYNKDSSLLIIMSRDTITIPPNSGANIETGFSLTLPKDLVFELTPSRNTSWKDIAFIRKDILTSIDINPVTVYLFNYSSSPITIISGEELCWGKFSTYVNTHLSESQTKSCSESSYPIFHPQIVSCSTRRLFYLQRQNL